jgi:type II restriction/modification system DNA methylase subunit YeeA
MNKNAIQKYAVWARNELIEQIKQRAYQYGISDKGYGDENATVIAGRVLTPDEKRQRREFVVQIKAHGFEQAVEEVAYTWFNRFVALRYMEVNDYLPTHIRVFSDANGSFNPEILKDVLHLDLPGLDKVKVSDLLNANKTEELYRYLLLTQCNALNEALPEMFEKLGGYTEMLLPNNILKPDSVLGRLVTDIPEEDFQDAVQIIGWMYQYYNTEPKQAVFDGLKKNIKITKEKIPAATQLFTPDWIVRYMVENSLGRLWLESHPNDTLKANWKYYLDEAEQTPEVAENLRILRSQSPVKSPEDIRLIDPCMGSGHILVYAFDVLMQIYESEGYNPRDAARSILEKNIYGLDIDRRAYQLAYFALMMKARQYNRRAFDPTSPRPQVYHPAGWSDGEEYGSLVKVDTIPPKPQLPKDQLSIFDDYERDLRIWNFKRLLVQKYDVVVTNPPYMGGKGQSSKLTEFLKENYPETKSDTFSAFIERCGQMAKPTGYVGMFTPYVWMFIQSYEKLRKNIYDTKNITTLIQFEYSAFEEATVPVCSFVYQNSKTGGKGGYFRLVDFRGGMEVQRQKFLVALENPNCGFFYTSSTENFKKIPGCPIAYWVSEAILKAFENGIALENYGTPSQGMSTCDVNRFIKLWYEVYICDTNIFNHKNKEKWVRYNKGGDFRKWYGNRDTIVFWGNDGSALVANNAAIRNKHQYFNEFIAWSKISSSGTGFRDFENDFLFDGAGGSFFTFDNQNKKYILGFLNSKVAAKILEIISPTLNYNESHIGALPIIISEDKKINVSTIVANNTAISRADWDSFETSWDFKCHPLVCGERTVASAFEKWERQTADRFETLKANEEELNRIFIDIYGLQDELTPEVEDKDITVRKADLQRDIKSLISYAVGCIFGRYSLDVDGLSYAGGKWDSGKYKTFVPDKDNVLPICDDEYFDDDIMGRFVDFVRVVYGEDTLEENLKFIADALGGNGTSREVIRNYFLKDFYKDHCKTYQKRPIYWLFDSGKKNGFKALIYMHRYSRDLLAKLRTDYVHEQQERYRTQLSHIAAALNTATGAERARLLKQQDKLTEQLKEITAFEEKVHHLADQNIEIDLDDGVKKNYEIFADVLAKI